MHRSMLDFTVDLPNNDLIVLGDEAAVQRLLSILLENSNRYTPPGGSVRLFASLDGDGVRISVGDTGVGIAPEHINRIFDRFYRVDPDGRSTRNGSGLRSRTRQMDCRTSRNGVASYKRVGPRKLLLL